MPCGGCGKKAIGKVKNIAKGAIVNALDIKYEFTDGRVRMCQKCDSITWMTTYEYNKWLFKNGIKVITNFVDLTVLPDLPDGENGSGKKLYCKKCKCNIPRKARVEDEKCPLDKWSK